MVQSELRCLFPHGVGFILDAAMKHRFEHTPFLLTGLLGLAPENKGVLLLFYRMPNNSNEDQTRFTTHLIAFPPFSSRLEHY